MDTTTDTYEAALHALHAAYDIPCAHRAARGPTRTSPYPGKSVLQDLDKELPSTAP
ncbi:hypothetical protein [Streptomyces sp. CAU 1734]|uniref:hypothetical protein n=1 Tax=Streptomyces sp. CAU 1734 TaxID=3140360 RepID=UPI0032619E85